MLSLLQQLLVLEIKLRVDLMKYLCGFVFLHIFSTLSHAFQLLLKLCLLVTAVFAELNLLLIKTGLLIN